MLVAVLKTFLLPFTGPIDAPSVSKNPLTTHVNDIAGAHNLEHSLGSQMKHGIDTSVC